MFRFAPALLTATLATSVIAQDNPNTILVMDGSGSMWGQIDGVAKITIAQEVVSGLMDTLPADQNIGLTVYGHRERGNCTDIETIVAPGPDTRGAIRDAVNAIKPLGKTPMTDSIIAAAEALRYTEDSATVILVSDGVETCNPDPCAAMLLLEEAGIDFTAHVVGFDVGSDALALSQMQCIADNTGGQFLTADNAEELGQALQTVAAEPEVTTIPMTFSAVIGDDKRLIQSPVLWDINANTGMVTEDQQANPLNFEIAEGAYVATAYSLEFEQTVSVDFIAINGGNAFIEAVFEEPAATATLIAPETALLGETIDVGWSGPGADRDYIAVSEPSDTGYINYAYVGDEPITALEMPAAIGTYELRYYAAETREVIATRSIEILPVEVTLNAADSAAKGAQLAVTWSGPNYGGDYIAIGLPGENNENYTYTSQGTTLDLEMPNDPGDYEIRYVTRQDNTVLATLPVTVTDIDVRVIAQATAPVGSQVSVGWDGPDYPGDFISVADMDGKRINYTYTSSGNPLDLEMPTEPGAYVIQYNLRQDNEVIATQPIEVVALEVSLNASSRAPIGSRVTVNWSGPDYAGDYISVADQDGKSINYTYTSDGNPLQLEMPVTPGDYMIRYQLRQDNEILATFPISTYAVKPEMTVPETANVGEPVSITWEGPDYPGDYLAVGEVGNNQSVNYTYTSDGTPLDLEMPSTPGDYEVRYVLRQDNTVLLRKPVSVLPIKAQLVTDRTGTAGSEILVGWDGPDYAGDYIALSLVGEDRSVTYAYTNTGNPVRLTLPDAPGEYELRYRLRQDNTIVARSPLTITE